MSRPRVARPAFDLNMTESGYDWPSDPKTVRILIVDDDTNVQLLLRSMLAQFDHGNAVGVRDLEHARYELSQHRVHIVFLDIHLAAGASGLDLLDQVAKLDPPPFVVMLTADSTMENFKRAMAHGAGYFMVKPFNGVKVKAALSKFHQTRTGV